MKKIAIKYLLLAAFLILVVVQVAHEWRVNEAADYYSSQPERVLYVLVITALIVAVGGILFFVFHRLSGHEQHIATLFALGLAAVLVTVLGGYLSFACFTLLCDVRSIVVSLPPDTPLWQSPVIFGLLFVSVSSVAAAAVLWGLFYRLLYRGKLKSR